MLHFPRSVVTDCAQTYAKLEWPRQPIVPNGDYLHPEAHCDPEAHCQPFMSWLTMPTKKDALVC